MTKSPAGRFQYVRLRQPQPLFHPSFMKGIYQIVDTFKDRNASAELGEDLLESEDGLSHMISHQVRLTIGTASLIIWSSEIPAAISVLTKAKEVADARVDRLFAEEDLSTPTL